MSINEKLGYLGNVTVAEATMALERVVADPELHATERMRAFLRYCGERTLSGRSDEIKAYSVALDVFGRKSDFNPGSDPIVRIEASRLRSALDMYYAKNRPGTDVLITMPRGRYVLNFERIISDARSISHVNSTTVPLATYGASPPAIKDRSRTFSKGFVIGLLTGAGAVAVSAALAHWAGLLQ